MNNVSRLIVPLLVMATLCAQAAPPADPRLAIIQQHREKLRKKWEEQFRAADTDNSRSLSREEAESGGLPASIRDHFEDIDTDHDGQLTPEELMAAFEKRLDAQK